MTQNPNQPREYDAVLGGQCPMPTDAAILGGIEGVKRGLASAVVQQRIAAVSDAPKYGEAGLDLVIRALQDESEQVERAAYRLLRDRTEPRFKQILQKHNPWRLWECLPIFNSSWAGPFAISPDGQTLVTESNNSFKVWNLHTGELKRTLQETSGRSRLRGYSLAISADGQTLVTGSIFSYLSYKTIKVWNLHTGELIRTLLESTSRWAGSFAISPDGQTLVSGYEDIDHGETLMSKSDDKTIKVWNLHTGELKRTLEGHSSYVYSVAISPDGQTLVSGSEDKTIKVWNLHTGELKRTLEGHSDSVNSVAISPDGQTLVSGSHDKTLKVWNLHTGELKRTLEGHYSQSFSSVSLSSVAISPDGQTLVSGTQDKTIKVWNLHTGELKRTLAGGHSSEVRYVAISPDGQTFVSASARELVLWGVRFWGGRC